MPWTVRRIDAKRFVASVALSWDHLNATMAGGQAMRAGAMVVRLLDQHRGATPLLCERPAADGNLVALCVLTREGAGCWATLSMSHPPASAMLLPSLDMLDDLFAALPGSAWSIRAEAIDERHCSLGNLRPGLDRTAPWFCASPDHRIACGDEASRPAAMPPGTRPGALMQVTKVRHPVWLGVLPVFRAAAARKAARFEPELTTSIVATVDDLPPPARRLLEQSESMGVQLGLSWIRNFCAHGLPGGTVVQFHILWRRDRVLAVLPIIDRPARHGGPGRLEALSNYYTCVYSPSVATAVTPDDLASLFRTIRTGRHRPGSLHFAPLDLSRPETGLLRDALERSGLATFGYFCFGNWFLQCRDLSWPAYLASRTSKLRSNIKRMHKKLTGDGGTLEVVTGGERLEAAIAAYWQVYRASWKQDEPFPDFIDGLMRTCADRGWLRLGLAWLEGKPIAAQLWIVANGKADIYKVAYDEAFKAYTAGTVLTAYMMEHVLSRDQVQEVDYLMGDDAYKRVWMSGRRERWGLVAYDSATLAGSLGLVREAAGRIVKAFRPVPGRASPSEDHVQ